MCRSSVFEGEAIPYPRREFLTDDDNDDKSNSKSATGGASSTHGQPPAKRARVMPPSTTSSGMNMPNYVSNITHVDWAPDITMYNLPDVIYHMF